MSEVSGVAYFEDNSNGTYNVIVLIGAENIIMNSQSIRNVSAGIAMTYMAGLTNVADTKIKLSKEDNQKEITDKIASEFIASVVSEMVEHVMNGRLSV